MKKKNHTLVTSTKDPGCTKERNLFSFFYSLNHNYVIKQRNFVKKFLYYTKTNKSKKHKDEVTKSLCLNQVKN